MKFHEESDWFSAKSGQGEVAYPAPFDQPFYMILNLAVGGSWVGYPDDSTTYADQQFAVDYVKYIRKTVMTKMWKTGKECYFKRAGYNGKLY